MNSHRYDPTEDAQQAFPSDGCLFCGVVADRTSNHSYDLFTRSQLPAPILTEGEHTFTVLDIAPISSFHCLIITKRHIPAFSYANAEEWSEHTRYVQRIGEAMGGADPLTLFEHGVDWSKRANACCIDHAHMHLVSNVGDLTDAIVRQGYEVIADSSDPAIVGKMRGRDYLLYRSPGTSGKLFDALTMPSQFMRRLIGELSNQEFWNWRDYLMFTPAETVLSRLNDERDAIMSKLDPSANGHSAWLPE